tara:strand:- start:361 stop:1680 length:1320 start_codon:yes stop_codon:yes gene_type:complete
MKYKILITVISLISLNTNSQEVLDLKKATAITLENNLNIKISENFEKISDNNTSFLNSGYLPTISAGSNFIKSNQNVEIKTPSGLEGTLENIESDSNSANISMNFIIVDGAGRKFNYRKSKELFNKSKLEVVEVIENTIFQLYTVYFEACRLIEEQTIYKNNLDISQSRLDRKRLELEYGQSTSLEVLNAEVDFKNDSINYLNTISNLSNVKRDLNLIMNVDSEEIFELITEVNFLEFKELNDAYSGAKENNTSLKIDNKNVSISKNEMMATKSTYLPTIGLIGSYGWNESINDNPYAFFNKNINDGFSGGVSLSWDIFNSGRKIIANKNAKIKYENSKIEKERKMNLFFNELNSIYQTHTNNLYIFEVQEKNLETNKLNFDRNLEQYKLGRLSSIQFRDAQLKLQRAELQKNTSKYNTKISELALMKISGQILTKSYK